MTSNQLYFAQRTVYELYKIDWMQRISAERQKDSLRNYFEELLPENEYGYTHEMWVDDNGYDGELYVCFNEFCDIELQDKEYIRELIGTCEPLMKYIEAYWNGEDLGVEVMRKVWEKKHNKS